jgi:hypothetical protein
VQIRKRYWFGLAALAAIGLIAFRLLPSNAPIINGQPLRYWLDQIRADTLDQTSQEFKNVLPAIDERCVPALIDELSWKPSPLLRSAEKFSRNWTHNRLAIHEPPNRRVQAALVLGWLGPRASNAIPALELLSRETNADSEMSVSERGAAIAALILIRRDPMEPCARKSLDILDLMHSDDNRYAIIALGTNAAPCVPTFIDVINSKTNTLVKLSAIKSLAAIHSQPELSVPILTSMLRETNELYRYNAARALSSFAGSAKPAWSNLVVCLSDSDPVVREAATNALWNIDFSAAQQLGVAPVSMP